MSTTTLVPVSPPVAPPTPDLGPLGPVEVPEFDIEAIPIEDETPVDNLLQEKSLRLLTEPLYSCWAGPGNGEPFVAGSDIGVFYAYGQPPVVPDVLLSVGVELGDLHQKANRTYFVWLRGKAPDVVIEIVTNTVGGEDTDKLRTYARAGVSYYAVYDPLGLLYGSRLRVYRRVGSTLVPMPEPYFFPEVNLGLTLWAGAFEGVTETWLRWCDRDGNVIPTGAERAAVNLQRATRAEEENERLKAHLRSLGIEPPT